MTEAAFVWAEDEAGWIGKNGQLPWHIPADLKHFKNVTAGHPVVMGLKTFKSLPGVLPGRENIVVTHQNIDDERITVVHSIDELKEYLHSHYLDKDYSIIGGAGLFSQTLSMVNILYRTLVDGNHDGDVRMVPIDYQNWQLEKRTVVAGNGSTIPSCEFQKWVRR